MYSNKLSILINNGIKILVGAGCFFRLVARESNRSFINNRKEIIGSATCCCKTEAKYSNRSLIKTVEGGFCVRRHTIQHYVI